LNSYSCLSLLMRHIELEFRKSTAVDLRNALGLLYLPIGRAQPIRAWRLPFTQISTYEFAHVRVCNVAERGEIVSESCLERAREQCPTLGLCASGWHRQHQRVEPHCRAG
jgi:hypothetical protein